jgi:hypothetical protein
VERKEMDFVLIEKCAQFDCGNHSDAKSLSGLLRGDDTVDRIVVSQRDRAQPAFRRGFDYALRWKYPVRRGGVSVQVDEPRPPRRCGHFS